MGKGKFANQKCSCVSGKKFKKCCLSSPVLKVDHQKHYFRLKGAKAEEMVQDLANKSFFIDWCYPNPKLPNGKELCDLLIIFDDIAIIWQIKDLKLDANNKYKKAEVEKNLKQLSGAYRQLFDLKTEINLANPRRGLEVFDPKNIKQVYLISALLGEGEDYYTGFEYVKEHLVHIFTRNFIEIALNELDTISDFSKYLKSVEEFHKSKSSVVIMGGYEELLAYYIFNGKSFENLNKANMVLLDEGSWNELQNKPEYIAKQEADQVSYGWDSIINTVHTGSSKYEKVAKELARSDRFQRRYLSKIFLDAHVISHNDNNDNLFRRMLPMDSCTYCFLFMDDPEPRENRKSMLAAMCFIARGIYKDNKKVIGVATEKKLKPTCSYDFCLLEMPEWTERDNEQMKKLQAETKIFTNPTYEEAHEDEFPQTK